jgi:hypothetical protein
LRAAKFLAAHQVANASRGQVHELDENNRADHARHWHERKEARRLLTYANDGLDDTALLPDEARINRSPGTLCSWN